jgi:bleomycin hydrolase
MHGRRHGSWSVFRSRRPLHVRRSLARNILSTFLTILVLLPGTFAHATGPKRSCTLAITAPSVDTIPELKLGASVPLLAKLDEAEIPPYGTLKPGFKHNAVYSNDLEETTPIKDQCNMGTCHLHSWASNLERLYFLRTGKTIELSAPFSAANHLFFEALGAMGAPLDYKIELAATSLASIDTLRKGGVVPASVWAPERDFYKAPNAARLEGYLQNITTRAKLKFQAKSREEQEKAAQEAIDEIQRTIVSYTGAPPNEFEWEGKTYTPLTFAKEFFPELFEPMIRLEVNNERNETIHYPQSGDVLPIRADIDEVEAMAKRLIDSGQSVYLAYQHENSFVDKKTGIMSIAAFFFPKLARPLTRKERSNSGLHGSGHAVQIVGYDADPVTGKIIKWKIKNSWGTDAGSNGYYHMYSDYFRAYAREITFFQSQNVGLPKATPPKAKEPETALAPAAAISKRR